MEDILDDFYMKNEFFITKNPWETETTDAIGVKKKSRLEMKTKKSIKLIKLVKVQI